MTAQPEVAWNPRTGTVWVRVQRRDVGKRVVVYGPDWEPSPLEWVWEPVTIQPPFVGGGSTWYRRELPDECVRLSGDPS